MSCGRASPSSWRITIGSDPVTVPLHSTASRRSRAMPSINSCTIAMPATGATRTTVHSPITVDHTRDAPSKLECRDGDRALWTAAEWSLGHAVADVGCDTNNPANWDGWVDVDRRITPRDDGIRSHGD